MLSDKTVVRAYFCVLACVGLYNIIFGKKESSNPVLKGRVILAIMFFLSSVGGGTVFGITEKTFSSGIAYCYALLIAALTDIALGYFVAPKIALRSSDSSIGGILFEHYGKPGRALTGVCATAVAIGYLAIQLNVSRKVFKHILHIDDSIGAWISYGVVALYTIGGGLKSLIFNSVLQFAVLIIAMPLLTATFVKEMSAIIKPADFTALLVPDFKELISLALSFMCMGLDPAFIQRNLLAESSKVARQAVVIKTAVYSFFISLAAVNGLAAKCLLPDADPQTALPLLITTYVPVGLSGIAAIGLLAAITSTADSALQVAVSSLKRDVLEPLAKLNNDLYAKALALLLGCIGVLVSLKFDYAVDVALFVAGCWTPILAVPIIANLYNKNISGRSLVGISLASLLVFAACESLNANFGLKSVFIATAANLILFCLAYLVEKQKVRSQ